MCRLLACVLVSRFAEPPVHNEGSERNYRRNDSGCSDPTRDGNASRCQNKHGDERDEEQTVHRSGNRDGTRPAGDVLEGHRNAEQDKQSEFRKKIWVFTQKVFASEIPCKFHDYFTAVASISIMRPGNANLAMPNRVPEGWQPAWDRRFFTTSCASKNLSTSVV